MDKRTYFSGASYGEEKALSIQNTERLLIPFPCPPLFEQPPFIIYERLVPGHSNRGPTVPLWSRTRAAGSALRGIAVAAGGLVARLVATFSWISLQEKLGHLFRKRELKHGSSPYGSNES